MQGVNSFAAKLKEYLPWYQAGIIFMAQFILSLFQDRTVNLCRVAEHFEAVVLVDSSYLRIKRFFQWSDFCSLQLSRLGLHD